MPATPVQETHTTVTTVQGGAVAAGFTAEFSAESTSTTTTQVQTEQVETVTVTETSSSGESHSSSHTSTTGGGAVFTSSERSEAHGSIEAHGSSVSGSSSSTTVTQGSGTIAQGFTTSVDGAASSTTVAHGSTSATSVGGAASSTTVAHGSTTTTSGASCTPAQPAQPAQPAPVKDSEHVQKKIRDGRLGAHGVNLGGWLVAEQWMSGSSDIWKDVPQGYEGEYQVLVHGNDRDQRLANFEKHHATFITEQDIAAIAKAGFNMVRVPVGYWILGDDLDDPGHKEEMKAFPRNTVQWVDKLIREWAVRHNVAVLVDIHAAKGSQNGDQHSAPTVSGQAFWGKYPENVRNTVLLAKFIGDRYKNDDAFLGIGLLNEPAADTDEKVLAQYHQDAYRAVRESGNNCILSCMPYRYKQEPDNLVGFMEAPEYTNVWIEWHPYFIWGNENKSGDELINQTISTEFQEKVNKWNSRPGANKLFISEWSLANTGQFRDPDSPEFAAWARAQVKVMNQAKAGWAYWSWHIEGDDKEGSFEAWSAKSVIRREPLRQILLESTDESAIAA